MVTIVNNVAQFTGTNRNSLQEIWKQVAEMAVKSNGDRKDSRAFVIAARRFIERTTRKGVNPRKGRSAPPVSPSWAREPNGDSSGTRSKGPDHLAQFGSQWTRQNGASEYAGWDNYNYQDSRNAYNPYEQEQRT